jgi:DNA mismatch endonuclease (patch repair protein)
MADILSVEGRSRVMALIRAKGNKSTELVLAGLFRKHRITGWRRHLPLPGKPDFCFAGKKVAVFVDGCFWHGCPKCYTRPKTNRQFWDRKRAANRARDRRVGRDLRARGFLVVRIYEHELLQPAAVLRRVRLALGRGGPAVPA